MIDLFVLACILSRVNTSVERVGPEQAEQEIQILNVFAYQAQRRIKANFDAIDDNADEEIKAIADHAFEAERFAWDTV